MHWWMVCVLNSTLASLVLSQNVTKSNNLPAVFWHGINDCCCDTLYCLPAHFIQLTKKYAPNLKMYSIQIGDTVEEEKFKSMFLNANAQVAAVCKYLSNDPVFKNGYNAIGFSQAGQFFRAVAQRCPNPPMNNLITLGAQHQGVFGIPNCISTFGPYSCDVVRKLLSYSAYTYFVQRFLVPAQYWNDPYNQQEFKESSTFLADINNIAEGTFNKTYKENLLKIKNLVAVMFDKDTTVVPKESSWFGFYAPGQNTRVVSMNITEIYTNDTFGLKSLDESGRLHLLSAPGDHVQIKDDWFLSEIVEKYLLNKT